MKLLFELRKARSFSLVQVVWTLKLPSVTGYSSLFTVVRVLFSFGLSAITYEVSLKTVPLKKADVVCQSLNKHRKLR